MAAIKGVDVLVYLTDATESTLTPIAGQKNATLSLSRDTIEVTTKDSIDTVSGVSKPTPAREYIAGPYQWTLSCDALLVQDIAFEQLRQAFLEGTPVYITMEEAGTGAGRFKAFGQAIITSLEFEASMDDVVTVSAEFQGTGGLKLETTTA